MKCPYCGAEVKGKICEYCDSEMPREKTNYHNDTLVGENAKTIENPGKYPECGNPKNKAPEKKTWLWVLGWIFIFPLPLTILLLKKKDMKPNVKYGIIAAVWLLFFIIGITADQSSNEKEQQVQSATCVTISTDNNQQ